MTTLGVAHGGLVAGDEVVYQPCRPVGVAELGVVTSLSGDPSLVFVRYAGQPADAPGKSTRVADLMKRAPGDCAVVA